MRRLAPLQLKIKVHAAVYPLKQAGYSRTRSFGPSSRNPPNERSHHDFALPHLNPLPTQRIRLPVHRLLLHIQIILPRLARQISAVPLNVLDRHLRVLERVAHLDQSFRTSTSRGTADGGTPFARRSLKSFAMKNFSDRPSMVFLVGVLHVEDDECCPDLSIVFAESFPHDNSDFNTR